MAERSFTSSPACGSLRSPTPAAAAAAATSGSCTGPVLAD